MRELERESLPLPTPFTAAPLAVIGRGRVGRSLARVAELAGIEQARELLAPPVYDALAARAKAVVRGSEGVSA